MGNGRRIRTVETEYGTLEFIPLIVQNLPVHRDRLN